MTLLQLIEGRERDLGGFSVRRVLPDAARPMVGPFIFFDHLGPAEFAPGHGIDVRPHPHIGLATVTYLFSGALEHRDNLGNDLQVHPGDVNWMTAGSGIAHSERTPQAERAAGPRIHGIQSWVALPDGQEDVEASFAHHPASTLPQRRLDGADLTVIAGRAFGMTSPVNVLWPTLYVDARLSAGASWEIPDEHEERAVYLVEGALSLNGAAIRPGQMAVLVPGAVLVETTAATRFMLLGGGRFPTPRHLYWNFVASSPERIEEAKRRWKSGGFAPVPNETEFIPLPS